MVDADRDRRRRLLGIKLAALVRDHTGAETATPQPFGAGAALVHGDHAWVLADDRPARSLGPALAWARQQGLTAVQLIVDDAGAAVILARRAAAFAPPEPQVWIVDGRSLLPAAPAPFAPSVPLDERLVALTATIEAGGATPVVEHGVLVGEVAGLEVCRATADDAGVRLEVGVGAHDREAFQIVHGDRPTVDALADVVRAVGVHRDPDAPPHPLKRLGAERLLRWRLEQDPAVVGAVALAPAPPPLPRASLKDPEPCVASGVDGDGQPLVVVCSVGIDLDLVPFAADARNALGLPDARLVIAVPERDAHPVTRALAARLRHPATIVPV